MLTLRVFLSSPGDVVEERRLAIETMRALEDSPLLRERVNLLVVAWDDPLAGAPLDARETPQQSVNRWAGRPADCDLTIALLWSRLGTPLPASLKRADGSRFASGTVWEVEDAIAADRPVFVYRRTEKPRIELDDAEFDAKRAQYDAVRRWFDGLRDRDGAWRAGVNEYANPAQFQQMLRAHLEAFIGRALAGVGAGAASTVAPKLPPPLVARPAPQASARRVNPWLLPAGSGVLLVVGLILVWNLPRSPAPDAAVVRSAPAAAQEPSRAAAPSTLTAPVVALPQVRLAGPAEVTFTVLRRSTYTVLALTSEAGTPTNWRLRIRVRLAAAANSGGMGFWDSSFRMLVDGVPRAADSRLNEIVESGEAKEREIVFNLPWALSLLALRVSHYGETADLPLAVSGARPPVPIALPPGPRRIALDGPAELAFPRSPRATYSILAIGSEARRPGVFGLRLRMRMQVFDGAGDRFDESKFRLLVDGVARAPDTAPREVVDSGAAKDGDVTFEVPDDAKQLVLRVQHGHDLAADVPLKLEPKR